MSTIHPSGEHSLQRNGIRLNLEAKEGALLRLHRYQEWRAPLLPWLSLAGAPAPFTLRHGPIHTHGVSPGLATMLQECFTQGAGGSLRLWPRLLHVILIPLFKKPNLMMAKFLFVSMMYYWQGRDDRQIIGWWWGQGPPWTIS